MRIEEGIKLDFDDVLIRPKRSTLNSRKEVDLHRSFAISEDIYIGHVPIMAANMDGVGTLKMAEALAKHGMFTCLAKHIPTEKIIAWVEKNKNIFFSFAISIGAKPEDLDKFRTIYTTTALKDSNEVYLCIDVANGYHERFVQFVREVRKEFPKLIIIAGNVATGEMTEELILNGANIVKVGIGPGSVCTTRSITGIGYPQLSSIMECSDAAHGLGGFIIADGGCRNSGDIVKAFGAGADYVMLGGLLAGHEEGGDYVTKIDRYDRINEYIGTDTIVPKTVRFYGMSSDEAQLKHEGQLKDYRASEGKVTEIPYKGPVDDTIRQILGGLRSACTYVGASKLKHLSKCTTFVRINRK